MGESIRNCFVSMACQRSLIFDYDVQDALLAGAIFLEMDHLADDISSNHIKSQHAKLIPGMHPSYCFHSFQFPSVV